MNTIGFLLQGFLFSLVWAAGGWLIIRGAFQASPVEQIPLALIVGLTLDSLFANMLGHWLPVQAAFWLAPLLVLLLGAAAAWGIPWKNLFCVPFLPWQGLALAFLTLVFSMAERGVAIFDDYAHLPTLSLIAAGDIPPHFPLNPQAALAYHYLLMVFAAQLTRIVGLEVWKSLDVSRALVFSVSILLAGVWVLRLTRSRAAGVLGGVFAALGMGTRWILLLFPPQINNWLGASVTMLGSGAGSGASLGEALARPWGVDGVGPVAFPFAFANGIYLPGILDISGPNSTFALAIGIFFLLTFNRWRSWRGALISALMIASMALLTEYPLVLSLISWGAIALLYIVKNKSLHLPGSLWQWLLVTGLGTILGLFQGGALSGMLADGVARMQGQALASYQTVGLAFSLEPALVSSHLGVLSLVQPRQLVLGVLEVGPVLLLLPWLAVWGIKAHRIGRWYEAALILSAFLSIGSVFLRYTGSSGVRNTSRMYVFISLCALYAVPLAWMWVSHRSERWKWGMCLLAAGMMFGGVVMLSVKLAAIQHPVYSTFLTALDARMYATHWDRLEPGALIFDPEVYRAPTVFGRPTLGFRTWFEPYPQWTALYKAPDAYQLREAGFSYAYIDNRYWDEIGQLGQQRLGDACVILVDELSDAQENFRRLYDLKGCEK